MARQMMCTILRRLSPVRPRADHSKPPYSLDSSSPTTCLLLPLRLQGYRRSLAHGVYRPQSLSPTRTRSLITPYQSILRLNSTIRLKLRLKVICRGLKSEIPRPSRKLEEDCAVSSLHHTCGWMKKTEKQLAHDPTPPAMYSVHRTNNSGRVLLST